jgi:hypothetical protein
MIKYDLFSQREFDIGRVQSCSCVFQNIDPSHPPLQSPPGECVLPATKAGGYTLARRRGWWGVNILEDARHRIGLLQ